MSQLYKKLREIRLGSHCWCVIKTSVVDEAKTDKPEFLIHLTRGYVQSKGVQLDDDGQPMLFVEISGQRVKASYVFKTAAQATSKAEAMMSEMAEGLKQVPQQS